jgi:hypothetical protein
VSGKGTEYRSVSFAVWKAPKRRLRFDTQGLQYSAPDQEIELAWTDIRAIVPAAVPIETSDGDQDVVPALGIALHVPFASPTLIDVQLSTLDYAIPLGDLAKAPFLGLSHPAEEIFEQAAKYARDSGVRVAETPSQA